MANLNKVMLIGNLTRDIRMSYLPSNTPVADLGMAINRTWVGQDGQKREEACFVDLTAFGKQAETLNKYLHKGDPLFVEGRLRYETWDDKQGGGKRSKLKVIVEAFQFLGRAGGGQGGGPREARPAQAPGPAPAAAAPHRADDTAQPAPDAEAYSTDETAAPPGDDIPF